MNDELDKTLEGMTNDQLEAVAAKISVILRERDGRPLDTQEAPSSTGVWSKIVAILQAAGRDALEIAVVTDYHEVVLLKIEMVTERPVRH
jgi:hypothetical protein